MQKIGVLLVHLGSPLQLSVSSIRSFLKDFLSDPLVVDYPRWFWLPILHAFILRKRPKKLLHSYSAIWKNGSPLHQHAYHQKKALQALLGKQYCIEIAMRYGCPCIASGLRALMLEGVSKICVVPLFPQHSITTTKSIEKKIHDYPENVPMHFVPFYHYHAPYIGALESSIKASGFSDQASQKLLFSFHSIPKRYLKKDKLYHKHCLETVRFLCEKMHLKQNNVLLGFQSKFGAEKWLTPTSIGFVEEVAKRGEQDLFVIAPGFSTDCLETIEEINIQMRDVFEKYSKRCFNYIPALNDDVGFFPSLIKQTIETK